MQILENGTYIFGFGEKKNDDKFFSFKEIQNAALFN